jgi:hypothetical protein
MILDPNGEILKFNNTVNTECVINDIYLEGDSLIKIVGRRSYGKSGNAFNAISYTEFNVNLNIINQSYSDTINDVYSLYPIFSNDGKQILIGEYDMDNKYPYIQIYNLNCELIKKQIIGITEFKPEGSLYNKYLFRFDNGYYLNYPIYQPGSLNYLTFYKLDNKFNPLIRQDFGKELFSKVYLSNVNRYGDFYIDYTDNSLFVFKTSFSICYDNNINFMYTMDTLNPKRILPSNKDSTLRQRTAVLNDRTSLLIHYPLDGYEEGKYFVRQINSEGKTVSDILFHHSILDSVGLGTFDINQTKSGDVYVSCLRSYKGNDWDDNKYPHGYMSVLLMKLDATLDVKDIPFSFTENTIYPNPSENYIQIAGFDFCDYKIYNLMGNLVQTGKFDNNNINIEKLTSGYYSLIISRVNHDIHYSKFIKK